MRRRESRKQLERGRELGQMLLSVELGFLWYRQGFCIERAGLRLVSIGVGEVGGPERPLFADAGLVGCKPWRP